jgi:acyl-CoA thioester hydrolase
MKFDYGILGEDGKTALAKGYTKHACLNGDGRVIRPPRLLAELIEKHYRCEPGA